MLTHPTMRQRGVTLIELVIAIAIMGIMLAFALPSYRAWIQNTQIRNAAESVQNGLMYAKAEAVRRNTVIRFGITSTGWDVAINSDNSNLKSGTQEGASNVVLTAANSTVTFNGLGRVIANTDGSATATQFDFSVSTAMLPDAEQRKLRVTVENPGGSIRMCDPQVTSSEDPRKC